jgi:type II secretory pathway pseudopilin PulG
MDRVMKRWRLILFIIMAFALIVMYRYASNQRQAYKKELEYQLTKAYQDSISMRRLLRYKDDEAFRYIDSLRQEKINYIKLQNEKQRVKIIREIKSIATATDSSRDDVWLNSWATEDSLIY